MRSCVSFLGRCKKNILQSVQTEKETHTAFCTQVTGALIPEVKWLGRKHGHLPTTTYSSRDEWSYSPPRNMSSRDIQGQPCFRVLPVSLNCIKLLVVLLDQQNVYKRWELNFQDTVKYPLFLSFHNLLPCVN